MSGLFLVLSGAATAGYIVGVGEEVEMNPWGTFHRTAPQGEDGWLYMVGSGGNWYVAETDAQHASTGQGETVVPEFELMIDRGLARCDDGGWLLAASGNVVQPNDSLWVWRFDEDWNVLGQSHLVDSEGGVATNDMGVVCSSFFSGVVITEGGDGGPQSARFYEVDERGREVGSATVSGLPEAGGCSLIADEDSQRILMLGVAGFQSDSLIWTWLDPDLKVLEQGEAALSGMGSGERAYWPQGLMKVGDLYLVAHMGRDEGQGWAADEGNVYLQVYDLEFNNLEGRQISQYEGPTGSMRPGFGRRGETLAMTWDAQNVPIVVDVELDLSGAHVPGDSADPVDVPDDSDGAGDSAGGGVPPDPACGCSAGRSAGGLVGLGLVGLAAFWRRRRR